MVFDSLGIPGDLITCALFFSWAAGLKRIPVGVIVISDQRELDLAIVDRLGQILPNSMATVDTYHQYISLEKEGFPEKAVLHARRPSRRLFEELSTYRSTTLDPCQSGSPSVWQISSSATETNPGSATLSLYSSSSGRQISQFVNDSITVSCSDQCNSIRGLMQMLIYCKYPLRAEIMHLPQCLNDCGLRPDQTLIVDRFVQVFCHLRRILSDFSDTPRGCLDDYLAVRALLQHLPLVPVDRNVSGSAIHMAEQIHAKVVLGTYQLALPDRSSEGHKWFTREDARKWTGVAYNTVKKRLQELEDDGQIVSSVSSDHRKQGTQLYYRFRDIHTPPNAWRNPFELLPLTP